MNEIYFCEYTKSNSSDTTKIKQNQFHRTKYLFLSDKMQTIEFNHIFLFNYSEV